MFIRLGERISGGQLDDLFWVWLFTGSKPILTGTTAAAARVAATRPARQRRLLGNNGPQGRVAGLMR